MQTIRILSANLSSQISAGEVIERPSSVVKELIENSIDAKSKNINISIKENGLQSIIVNDDGYGIKKNELLLAISPHATSKIHTIIDLNNINTFGFRGEALSSIRSISRINVISCYKHKNIGWNIYSEGMSYLTTLKPIAHPLGTTVIVENLFYNIPIRLKFIKNKNLECLKIFEIIKKIALSHFHVNFSFKRDKKHVLYFNAIKKNENKIYRLKEIFNDIDINSVLEIKEEIKDIIFFGWLIFSHLPFKKIQYSYINNRYVNNKLVKNAVFRAFDEVIGSRKKISFVIYITLPPNKIDVNIHPTKRDIQFREENLIYFFLYKSLLFHLKKSNMKYFQNSFSYKKNLNECEDYNSSFLQLDKKYNVSLNNQKNNLYKDMFSNDMFSSHSQMILKKNCFSLGRLLIVFQNYYGLIYNSSFFLISFPFLKKIVNQYKLKNMIKNHIIPKNFSFHFTFFFNFQKGEIFFNNKELLLQFGFKFLLKSTSITFNSIPDFLKGQKVDLLSNFLSFFCLKQKIYVKDIVQWFDKNILIEKKKWNYIDGTSLLLEVENFYPSVFKKPSSQLLKKIDIDTLLCTLKI
ncbi:DNA mismatch repair endonuclease MutL [Buchnera aphidicola]|uniref:DNA mismatch repair endonuclease MutL n=1 Tax=Buchnera aphidicola TaxID=9 RepID=UPI003463FEAB